MDVTSLLGIFLGLAFLATSAFAIQGTAYKTFLDYPSLLLVLGGTLAAVLASFPLHGLKNALKTCRRALFSPQPNFLAVIDKIVHLSEIARREGLLALEKHTHTIDDPFLTRAIQMAVDGTRPDVITDILRTQMEVISLNHKNGRSLAEQFGRFAPAFGLIGTIAGMIFMLGNMSTPDKITSGVGMALITTLYGAIIANLFCLPFAEKINYLSHQELLGKEIILRGVLGIQAGDNPRVIEQRLRAFLPEESMIPVEHIHRVLQAPKAKNFSAPESTTFRKAA